jgi:hypothetical protein
MKTIREESVKFFESGAFVGNADALLMSNQTRQVKVIQVFEAVEPPFGVRHAHTVTGRMRRLRLRIGQAGMVGIFDPSVGRAGVDNQAVSYWWCTNTNVRDIKAL